MFTIEGYATISCDFLMCKISINYMLGKWHEVQLRANELRMLSSAFVTACKDLKLI